MQALARDGMSADQVRAALTSDAPVVSWAVTLVNADGTTQDISDDCTACTVTFAAGADVARALTLTTTRTLDWPNVLVKPSQTVNGATFDLGVFTLVTPTSTGTSGSYEVQGYDLTTRLQRTIGDTYVVPTGSNYLASVRQALADAGVTQVVNLDSSRSDAVTSGPLVWALVLSQPDGWVRPVNDLLSQIGYTGIYADEEGNFAADRYVAPALRASEWDFNTTDTNTSIVWQSDRSLTVDAFVGTNWWRGVQNNYPSRPSDGAGQVTVNKVPAGALPVKSVQGFDAVDQTALQSLVDQWVDGDTQQTTTVQIKTGPLPCLGLHDVVTYTDPDLSIAAKATITAWSQILDQAECDITMGVING